MKKPNQDQDIDETISLVVTKEDISTFKRLDKYLSEKLIDQSRTFIKNLFDKGLITSLDLKLELKKMPPEGSTIFIDLPAPLPAQAIAEDIPLEILFEDDHLIIVNKKAGMVTHPAPGNYTGTLVNAILFHCPDIGAIGDQIRPGIVHRLDKGTSGVMVVAKNQKTHEGLIKLFSKHDIIREYQCLTMSAKLKSQGKLDASIGRHPVHRQKMAINTNPSKEAVTYYEVKELFGSCSHLFVTLETGRTHQIRVHLSSLLKAPILNDYTYGNPKQDAIRLSNRLSPILKNYEYPFLHARKLGFIHPITQKELVFEAEPPKEFQEVLDILRSENE